MTIQILLQLIGFVAFLTTGWLAHKQWERDNSRERLIFSICNFVGAGVALGLILATIFK